MPSVDQNFTSNGTQKKLIGANIEGNGRSIFYTSQNLLKELRKT